MTVYKIVSGGGIGAELGAMQAAKDLGLAIGGFLCEFDLPPMLGVIQRTAPSRAMQRRLNVQDSDGTLFVLRHDSKPMKFIVDACRAQRKPAKQILLHDSVGAGAVIDELRAWIEKRNIGVLNVVGDASESDTYQLLHDLVEPQSMRIARHPHPGFVATAITQQSGRAINGFDAVGALSGDGARDCASYTEWWDFIESWKRLGIAKYYVVHLSQYQSYDEDEMWCGAHPVNQTHKIWYATCPDCLEEAMAYGRMAAMRREVVACVDNHGRIGKEQTNPGYSYASEKP